MGGLEADWDQGDESDDDYEDLPELIELGAEEGPELQTTGFEDYLALIESREDYFSPLATGDHASYFRNMSPSTLRLWGGSDSAATSPFSLDEERCALATVIYCCSDASRVDGAAASGWALSPAGAYYLREQYRSFWETAARKSDDWSTVTLLGFPVAPMVGESDDEPAEARAEVSEADDDGIPDVD